MLFRSPVYSRKKSQIILESINCSGIAFFLKYFMMMSFLFSSFWNVFFSPDFPPPSEFSDYSQNIIVKHYNTLAYAREYSSSNKAPLFPYFCGNRLLLRYSDTVRCACTTFQFSVFWKASRDSYRGLRPSDLSLEGCWMKMWISSYHPISKTYIHL